MLMMKLPPLEEIVWKAETLSQKVGVRLMTMVFVVTKAMRAVR